MDKNENEKIISTPISEERRKGLERPLGSSSKPFNYKELENVDKNYNENFQEVLKAKNNSVLKFSNDLNWPLEYFFAELKSAGVEKKSAHEQLTDQDKADFLTYIIRYYRKGLDPANKLKPSVPLEPSPLNNGNKKEQNTSEGAEKQSSGDSFIKFSDEHKTQLQRFIAQYSILPRDQINELWNQGANDFKGDERHAIYLVYREKSKKNIQTEYAVPSVPFVKKCPFCNSVLNKSSSLCEGCGTGFSSSPSLLFYDNKEDVEDDENNT